MGAVPLHQVLPELLLPLPLADEAQSHLSCIFRDRDVGIQVHRGRRPCSVNDSGNQQARRGRVLLQDSQDERLQGDLLNGQLPGVARAGRPEHLQAHSSRGVHIAKSEAGLIVFALRQLDPGLVELVPLVAAVQGQAVLALLQSDGAADRATGPLLGAGGDPNLIDPGDALKPVLVTHEGEITLRNLRVVRNEAVVTVEAARLVCVAEVTGILAIVAEGEEKPGLGDVRTQVLRNSTTGDEG